METGGTFGFWVFGQMIFLGVVVLANLKILTFSSTFSVLGLVAFFGSVTLFVISWIWVSSFEVGEIEFSYSL